MSDRVTTPQTHFADRVIGRVRELGHPLCVGLDPHLDLIPPLFRRGTMRPGDSETPAAVESFVRAILERAFDRVAIVKPQVAFFEQLGPPGWQVLASLVALARSRGVAVLLDAKRGDMGSTAEGYARAYLGRDAALPVDAMTTNPYLGVETLEPYVAEAKAEGRGVFVLTKTSNPGSGDFQDLDVGGEPLFERVAGALEPMARRLVGPKTGWSSLGLVVGATYPEQGERLRARLPRALFLVPGFGYQGGTASDAVRGFSKGPNGLEGGVVSSSRGVSFPKSGQTDDPRAWEAAVDGALDAAIEELGEAVSGG